MKEKIIVFHSGFNRIAGTERTLYNVLQYLSIDQKREVTLVLASPKTDLVLGIEELPINIKFLGVSFNENNFITLAISHIKVYVALVNKLRAIIKNKAVYIGISTNPFHTVMLYLALKNIGISCNIIAWEHFAHAVTGKLSRLLRKIYYRKFYVVCLTEKDKNLIRTLYGPLKTVSIANAVPFTPRTYHTTERKKEILAVGRLTTQKGFDLLIRAYAKVAKSFPDWRLKIVGDDYGDLAMLEQLKSHFQISNLDFLPATPYIEEHYQQASFFVLSSRFEGLPMVLLEAMAFGLPIISFDCPTGPAQLVDNENGALIEAENIDALAKSMAQFMADPLMIEQRAHGAERRILSYTPNHINKKWFQLFDEISKQNQKL